MFKHEAIATYFKGKIEKKAYLFDIKYLNFHTSSEMTIGTILVNSQSSQTSIRITNHEIITKSFEIDLIELSKQCLDYADDLEKRNIIF